MNNFELKPGARFGAWEILSADVTGKRIACRCSCGQVRIVAASALKSGANTSCGCKPPTTTQREAARNTRREQMLLSDFGYFDD